MREKKEKSKESMIEDIIITIRKEPSMNILKKIKIMNLENIFLKKE